MDGSGARAKGEGVFCSHPIAKLVLEGVDIGAEGGDPIAIEGLLHVLLLETGHVGWGKIEAAFHRKAITLDEYVGWTYTIIRKAVS